VSADRCLIPGCRRLIRANGLCDPHRYRLEVYGDARADDPIGTPRRGSLANPTRAMAGPFLCLCPTSKPDSNGACTECGYPCVHRMAPRVRETALVKRPSLRHQAVEPATPSQTTTEPQEIPA